MIEAYRAILGVLDRRERRHFLALAAMGVALGLIEALGVVSVLPLIALAADPAALEQWPTVGRLAQRLGFVSAREILIALGIASFALLVVGVMFRMATLYFQIRFGRLQALRLGTRLLRGYLQQPYAGFLKSHSAELMTNVLSEVEQVVRGSIISGLRFIACLAITLSIVAVLVVADPVAALAVAGLLGAAYGGAFLAMRKRIGDLGTRRVGSNAARHRALVHAIGGFKDVKLRGAEESLVRSFAAPAKALAETRAQMSIIEQVPRNVLEITVFGGMVLFVLWALLTEDGDLLAVLPKLGLYAVGGLRLSPVLQQTFAAAAAMRFDESALLKLRTGLAEAPSPLVGEERVPLGLHKALELEAVTFQYPDAARTAVTDVTLRIEAGTTVGIVGATGAGKSTVVDIVLGLLEPQAGVVRVDGVVLGAGNIRAWRRSVGHVPQEIFLTDASIAENIAFGEEAVDFAAVERAARAANLHAFISSLPGGYSTAVGERGVRLSGGQRQRIGIARALYGAPSVLVFDEATSALDSVTESEVIDALDQIGGDRTLIMVAHRLGTVRRCHRIFLMDAGKVVAEGSYAELLVSEPHFQNFHRAASGT